MKTVRIHSYGHSDQLKIEETPRPELKPRHVLVRIIDAGVNPVDWKIREGYMKEMIRRPFPMVMGQDFSGQVVEVGADAGDFQIGDEVFGFAPGSYAEYASVSIQKISRKPRSIDHATAASVPTAGLTAHQCVIEAIQISSGQSILIHGAAGGVGSFAVQLARWKGARIVATASREDSSYLKGLGVEQVIDYRSERFEEKVQALDAVLDLVGGETLSRSFEVVRPGGIVVTTVGPLDKNHTEKRNIRGVQFVMQPNAQGLAELAHLIDQGVLRPRISRVLPLSEARTAQDINQNGHSRGKIVLQVA